MAIDAYPGDAISLDDGDGVTGQDGRAASLAGLADSAAQTAAVNARGASDVDGAWNIGEGWEEGARSRAVEASKLADVAHALVASLRQEAERLGESGGFVLVAGDQELAADFIASVRLAVLGKLLQEARVVGDRGAGEWEEGGQGAEAGAGGD